MARKAFVMGSNGTEAFGRLKYARRDAERLADILASPRCGFQVSLTTTCADPFQLHRDIATHARACDDSFVCYFSGHGVLDRGELFLVLDDTGDDLYTTALPVRHVLDVLRFCEARNKLLILDCCHAGGAVGVKGSAGVPVAELKIESENHLVLMASGRLEQARELDELQGSFLASSICAALGQSFHEADRDKDERLSIEDLKLWLEEAATLHNQRSAVQVPCPHLFGQQKGAFFLTVNSGWSPYEIPWPDGSTIVILPVQPIGPERHWREPMLMACGIGKHPTTNAQYRAFVESAPNTRTEPQGQTIHSGGTSLAGSFYPWRDHAFCAPDQPVVCVSFEDAIAYCEWVNQLPKTSKLGITCMPSHELWEYAAYGTEFPTLAPSSWLGQTSGIHHQATSPATVDTTGARTNKRGVADMFGNVWEWCSPTAEPSVASLYNNDGRHAFSRDGFDVLQRLYLGRKTMKPGLRGGSFLDNLARVEPRMRATELQARERTKHSHLGFRVAALVPINVLPEHVARQLRLCPPLQWAHAVELSLRALLESTDF